MQQAAIIVTDPQQQFEGLRTSIGLLRSGLQVQMYLLHHEVEHVDEEFINRLESLDKIGGQRYSNISGNVDNFGFTPISIAQAAEQIRQADIVIPF